MPNIPIQPFAAMHKNHAPAVTHQLPSGWRCDVAAKNVAVGIVNLTRQLMQCAHRILANLELSGLIVERKLHALSRRQKYNMAQEVVKSPYSQLVGKLFRLHKPGD